MVSTNLQPCRRAVRSGVFYGDVPCYTVRSEAITAGCAVRSAVSERSAFSG
jgi:hypothetical protein